MYKNSRTVLFRWFSSYLIIMLIPLLFSLLVYTISYNIINQQISKIHGASMDQIRAEIDSRLNEMQLTLQQMSFNRDILAASHVVGTPRPADQLTYVNVIEDLKYIQLTYPYLDNAIVFLNSSDSVAAVSGHMSQELMYHLYFQNDDMDFVKFQSYVRQWRWHDILKMTNTTGKTKLLMSQTLQGAGSSGGDATLMLTLNTDYFREYMKKNLWDEGIQIFIMNEDGKIIASTGDIADTNLPYAALSETEEFDVTATGDRKHAVLVRDSAIVGWKYVSLIPTALLKNSAGQIQRYTLLGFFFCLIGGLFISYRMTKRNYSPLKRILSSFEKTHKGRTDGNEFDWIEKQVQEVINEKGDSQRLLWNNLKTLQKFYIYTLLQKPYDPLSSPAEMERYQLGLRDTHNAYNVVVLFTDTDLSHAKTLSEQDGDHINIIKYVILNIFREVAGEHFNVEMTDVGLHVAAIISLPSDSPQLLETLEEDIAYTQQRIQEHFQSVVFAAVGGTHPGLEGIYYSNLEADETLRYASFSDQGVLFYEDIRSMASRYVYPIELEQKLINYLCAGDSDNACATLVSVFDANRGNGIPSASLTRCLGFDLLATLLKGAERAGCPTNVDFSAQQPDWCAELCVIARRICGMVLEKRENRPTNQLSAKVKEYIRENYADPDLNISITGQRFDITPAYLSNIFKEETGQGLLDFITDVRIERCKALLMEGRSVVEISDIIGFRGSGALIRVFKRKTGLTPGRYKEIYLQENTVVPL